MEPGSAGDNDESVCREREAARLAFAMRMAHSILRRSSSIKSLIWINGSSGRLIVDGLNDSAWRVSQSSVRSSV